MTDSFRSELAERLLRRATRPVGVVDVRPVQERYERAAAWPRQHVAMLDRAAARQQADAQAGPDQRLLLAARPLESPGTLRDLIPGGAVMDALRASPNALSPASLARIAARQRAGAPDAVPAAPPAAASESASNNDGPSRPSRGETFVGPPMHAVTRSSADLPLPSRGGRSVDRNRSKAASLCAGGRIAEMNAPVGPEVPAVPITAPTTTAPPSSMGAAEPAPTTTGPRASVVQASETAPATTDTPHVFVQRKAAALGIRDSGFGIRWKRDSEFEVRESRVADSGVAAHDLPFAVRDSHVSGSAAATLANPPDLPNLANPTGLSNPANPESRIPSPLPALPLRTATRSAVARRSEEARAAARPAPAAAAERGAVDAAPLQLVWRRGSPHETTASAANTSAHAGAAGSVVAATGSPAMAAASSTTLADAAAAAAAAGAGTRDGAGGPDLDQIVEEVMRRLTEVQTIERERRGDPWL